MNVSNFFFFWNKPLQKHEFTMTKQMHKKNTSNQKTKKLAQNEIDLKIREVEEKKGDKNDKYH